MALFDRKPTAQPSRQQSVDPFNRIGDSEGRQGGVYPVAGVYPLLYVDVLKMIRSRKGDDVFVAEFDIVQSEVAGRCAGTRMSWAVNFRHDASPGNVKAFLAAVMDVLAEQVDSEGASCACGPDNPCHGRFVRLEATQTETKSGNPLTLCNWRPVADELQGQADELRQSAGFTPF